LRTGRRSQGFSGLEPPHDEPNAIGRLQTNLGKPFACVPLHSNLKPRNLGFWSTLALTGTPFLVNISFEMCTWLSVGRYMAFGSVTTMRAVCWHNHFGIITLGMLALLIIFCTRVFDNCLLLRSFDL